MKGRPPPIRQRCPNPARVPRTRASSSRLSMKRKAFESKSDGTEPQAIPRRT